MKQTLHELVSSHLHFSEVHGRKYNSFYCETFILWFVTHKHCSRRESVAVAICSLANGVIVVRFPIRVRDFSLLQSVRTGHGSNLTCFLDASNDLWNGKATGTTRCHLVPRLRISEAMPLILRRPLRRVQRFTFCQILFTFLLFCLSVVFTSVETFQNPFLDSMSYPVINCHR